MACVQIQCLVPPCPEICDGVIQSGSPSTVDRQVWSTEKPLLQSTNIDTRLLMGSTPRNVPAYSGASYPSAYGADSYVPDFSTSTESLDWWRLAMLAIGIIIGAAVLSKL